MRKRTPQGNEDNTHIKCKYCGFWCDVNRNAVGGTNGNTTVTVDVGGTSVKDPTVTRNCPFCGSPNWK